MPHPRTLLSVYPPNNFEEIITKQGPSQINVYVDLKNVMTSLFVPSVVEEIALNSKNGSKLDSSIFQSVLFYSSWWRKYTQKFQIPCQLFVATDLGRSVYHRQVYPGYKKSRDISNTSLTPYDAEFVEIRAKNSELADQFCKQIPNLHFYLLRYLEADFVPYWLMTRKFDNPNILHVLCSCDHDMYQAINKPNIFQLFKYRSERRLLDHTTCLFDYLDIDKKSAKMQEKNSDYIRRFDIRYIPAMMAVVGDPGDDVPGVTGIGPSKSMELFMDQSIVDELIGTPEELDERVASGGMFLKSFDPNKDYGPWNKILSKQVKKHKFESNQEGFYDINKLITDSFKMISFEQLCLWLEKKDSTEKINYLKYMNSITDKPLQNTIPTPRVLASVLGSLEDNYLTEQDMEFLY